MMRFGRSGWMSDIWGEPQTRGFMWGVGAAMAGYFLWPAVKEAVRPATKGVVRGAMTAGDRFRYAMSGAKERIEDVIAEAQFERMRDAVGDKVDQVAEGVVEAVTPAGNGRADH